MKKYLLLLLLPLLLHCKKTDIQEIKEGVVKDSIVVPRKGCTVKEYLGTHMPLKIYRDSKDRIICINYFGYQRPDFHYLTDSFKFSGNFLTRVFTYGNRYLGGPFPDSLVTISKYNYNGNVLSYTTSDSILNDTREIRIEFNSNGQFARKIYHHKSINTDLLLEWKYEYQGDSIVLCKYYDYGVLRSTDTWYLDDKKTPTSNDSITVFPFSFNGAAGFYLWESLPFNLKHNIKYRVSDNFIEPRLHIYYEYNSQGYPTKVTSKTDPNGVGTVYNYKYDCH